MAEVILRGKRIRFTNDQAIGKGGEADIFDIGNGEVLKIFKPADHPDLAMDPAGRAAAARRIQDHQQKLPELLKLLGHLPPEVVMPQALATTRTNAIVGYAMSFLARAEVLMRFGQRSFRQGMSTESVIGILKRLHRTVAAIHQAGVVIGDFNDLNVLVDDQQQPHVIDADSMQFGAFPCGTYTTTFVDPLLCDPNGDAPVLIKPHCADGDWYAFTVIAMLLLLFVGPYGGVAKGVLHNKRPLQRVTIFSPTVRYPKAAVPIGMLPDELLHHFHGVFEKDERGVFPLGLLERLRWTKCAACGTEHGRSTCPSCSAIAPAAIRETTTKRGRVTATKVFPSGAQASARLLRAEMGDGRILWLCLENGRLRREGGADLGAFAPDPRMRFRLRAHETMMASGTTLLRVPHGKPPARLEIDAGPLPMFDANETTVFWAQGDMLLRDKAIGTERIGDVLRGQTMFWVGPAFGFGFYRAGSLSKAFVFTASNRSLNDGVKMPAIVGKLIDAACCFSKERAWFFTSSQEGARTVNRCTVIQANGSVEVTAEADNGDGSWLGKIRGGAAGEAPAGGYLLMPTDEGVVQLRAEQGRIFEAKRFPDTEPFVDSDSKLLIGADGLYVVTAKDITRLVIS